MASFAFKCPKDQMAPAAPCLFFRAAIVINNAIDSRSSSHPSASAISSWPLSLVFFNRERSSGIAVLNCLCPKTIAAGALIAWFFLNSSYTLSEIVLSVMRVRIRAVVMAVFWSGLLSKSQRGMIAFDESMLIRALEMFVCNCILSVLSNGSIMGTLFSERMLPRDIMAAFFTGNGLSSINPMRNFSTPSTGSAPAICAAWT